MLTKFDHSGISTCRGLLLGGALFMSTLLLFPAAAFAAEKDVITFTTAPTQSVAETNEIYGPLARYLSEASGKTVKLVPVRNFLEYTSRMRKDEFDMIFDGPHFVSWRMENKDHVPLARLPGELIFMVAVKDGGTISKMDELVSKKVCAVNSPNLATLMILDAFPNPVRQPVIVSEQSFQDAMKCLKDGKGEAAFLPIKFWKKFEKGGKTKGFRLMYETSKQPLPPRTFSMSKRVDADTREKIRQALINAEGKAEVQPLLDRFRSKKFIEARDSEYADLSRLLLSIWGFHE